MTKTILYLLLFAYISLDAKDMIRVIVSGKDAKQQVAPLIGANVFFEKTNDGTTTDLDGVAQLELKDDSGTKVVISYLGYKNDTLLVSPAQKDYPVELIVDAQVLKNVDVVTKQSSSFVSELNPAKTEKISGTEFKKAACCNLSESFQTNSSVDVNYQDAVTGAKEIKLLGLSGLYVQNLLEAMPFMRGLTASYGLDNVPAPWIKNISISKGVPSVKSGYEGITGSLNLDFKTSFNTPEKWYVDFFGNQNGRIEVNTILNHKISPEWGTMLFANGSFTPTKQDQNHDGFLDQPKIKQYNIANRWNHHSEHWEGQYMIKALSENRIAGQQNYNPMQDRFSDSIFGININTKRVEAFAKTGIILNKNNSSIGTQFSGVWHQQDAVFGLQQYQGKQGTFSGNILYQTDIKNEKNTWASGISFIYDNWQEQLNSYVLKREDFVPGIFAEYTFKIPDKLTLVAGVRGDYSTIAKFEVNPRLHIKYNITDKTILFIAAGKGFRVPSIISENQPYLASSRVWDIKEIPAKEEAWNYGISLLQKFEMKERPGSVNVDFYRTDFIHQVVADIDNSDNILTISNLNGKSFSNSLLVEFNLEILKGLDFKAAYKFEDVRTTYHGQLLIKPLQARNKGLISLSYKTPNKQWQFDVNTSVNGKRRLPNSFAGDSGNRFSKPYVLLNAQILKIFKNAELFLGCENITNFIQKNSILNADKPFEPGFDANQVWGPTMGYTIYGGFRYSLKD